MATKFYLSKYLSFATHWHNKDGKKVAVFFLNGAYATDNAGTQEHIEGLDIFGSIITVKSDEHVKRDHEDHAAHMESLAPVRKAAAVKVVAQQKKAAKTAVAVPTDPAVAPTDPAVE